MYLRFLPCFEMSDKVKLMLKPSWQAMSLIEFLFQ